MIPLLNFIGLVVSLLRSILLFCDACERVPICVKERVLLPFGGTQHGALPPG
jgi:hypothetical protein